MLMVVGLCLQLIIFHQVLHGSVFFLGPTSNGFASIPFFEIEETFHANGCGFLSSP